MKQLITYTLLFAFISVSLAWVSIFLIAQAVILGPPLTLDNLLFMAINAHLGSVLMTIKLIQYTIPYKR